MELKGTLFRFVALFALLLALGVVSTSQATVAAAANLTSIQDTEDPDQTEDAVDETTDETEEVFGDEGTPAVEAIGTGGGDTTLPDTGSGSGVMSASGGVVAAMLGVFALMMVAVAVITRRRQGASSGN